MWAAPSVEMKLFRGIESAAQLAITHAGIVSWTEPLVLFVKDQRLQLGGRQSDLSAGKASCSKLPLSLLQIVTPNILNVLSYSASCSRDFLRYDGTNAPYSLIIHSKGLA